MRTIDAAVHNPRQQKLWEDFEQGHPSRTPVILGINPRYYLGLPEVNVHGISFKEYTEDPAVMMGYQCRCEEYRRLYIPFDEEKGLPEFWSPYVDWQNFYDAAWWGAEVVFIAGNVPDTHPFLTDDNKYAVLDAGAPAPDARWMGKALEYYERMQKLSERFTYHGIPAKVQLPHVLMSFDGPFTVACNIRGASQICLDLYEDPDYAHQLLELITEATIARIRYWRKEFGLPEHAAGHGFADDSIALLSPAMYREFVLPCHKRMIEELGDGVHSNAVHLCGDSSRHFVTIRDELNVKSFDTGYPIDHAKMAEALGPDVRINGGPHVELLRLASAPAVKAECRRILESVKPFTRRFVLREGNNLPPGVPLENLWAMYEAAEEYGAYTD